MLVHIFHTQVLHALQITNLVYSKVYLKLINIDIDFLI